MRKDGDAVLREKKFASEGVLELRSELNFPVAKDVSDSPERDHDEAIGTVHEIFVEGGGGVGPTSMKPVEKSERRANWVLLSVMVVAYSLMSLLIGVEFEAEIAIPILLVLSIFGLFLGERWIKDPDLNLLGVAWVIISMKILYGASLELNNWSLGEILPLSIAGVGVVLVVLVLFNIFLSYRYNSDAIAAQATLVLLAVGSTTGSVAGEDGVILMLIVSVFLLHSIAIHRSSGNLASLGIVSSNIWFGMHVITGGFDLGSLTVVGLQHPLKLFIAITSVNMANAYVATKFAKSKNWFSEALEILGVGKPGLWGVSVVLSLTGAFLTIGSIRQDISFAFAIIVLLSLCYFPSYLVVRGSPKREVFMTAGASILLLSVVTILFESGIMNAVLDSYWVFSIGGGASLFFLLAKYQGIVSDTVLWTGSIGLTLLVLVVTPLDESTEYRMLFLISALSLIHIAGGLLSIRRKSASLAGVAVLTPWLWPTIMVAIYEIMETISLRNGNDGTGGSYSLEIGVDVFVFYLALSSICGAWVCSSFKEASLNVSSGLAGTSEMTATIKQTEIFNLWNLALWIPLVSSVVLSLSGQIGAIEAALVFAVISCVHSISSITGIRIPSTTLIPITIGIGGVLLQWVGGDASIIILVVGISLFIPLMVGNWNPEEDWLVMVVQSGPVLTLFPVVGNGFSSTIPWLPDPVQCVVAIMGASVFVGALRTRSQVKILPLSTVLISHSTMVFVLSILDGRREMIWLSVVLFAFTSVWFVTRGEILRELRSSTEKSRRTHEVNEFEEKGHQHSVHLPIAERSKMMSSSGNIGEAYINEVRHYPVLAIVVIVISSAALGLYSLILGPEPLLILAIGAFLATIVALEGLRSRRIEVRVASALGSDVTHSIAVIGVCSAVVFGHLNPASSVNDLLDFGMAIAIVIVLGAASLANGERGVDSKRSLINWIVFPLAATRLAGFAMIGSLPAPLSVDPFDGSLVSWTYPFLMLETVLLLSILMDVIVDYRSPAERARSGMSEVGFASSVLLLSWGPAGLIAVIRGVASSVRGKREKEAGIISLLLPISFLSIEPVLPFTTLVGDAIVIVELALFSAILFFGAFVDLDRWSVVSVQNTHILLVAASFFIFNLEIGVIALIAISSITWTQGVTRLRRGLRITGLIDLSIAMIIGIMIWLSSMSGTWLLILTIFLSAELAIVLWLSQRNMDLLEID